MRDKDRARLHAAAFLLGIVDAHGNEVDEDAGGRTKMPLYEAAQKIALYQRITGQSCAIQT
jgi:hypothetical protein